jgi:hypothetical protein
MIRVHRAARLAPAWLVFQLGTPGGQNPVLARRLGLVIGFSDNLLVPSKRMIRLESRRFSIPSTSGGLLMYAPRSGWLQVQGDSTVTAMTTGAVSSRPLINSIWSIFTACVGSMAR